MKEQINQPVIKHIMLNTDVTHWVKIQVLNQSRNIIVSLLWKDLPIQTRLKFDWYFKYRAALCQVQHPKFIVQFTWGNEPAVGKSLKNIIANKIKAKKGKITKYRNEIDRYKQEFESYKSNYRNIFNINEEPEFITYTNSILLAENKIAKLQSELNQLIQDHESN